MSTSRGGLVAVGSGNKDNDDAVEVEVTNEHDAHEDDDTKP